MTDKEFLIIEAWENSGLYNEKQLQEKTKQLLSSNHNHVYHKDRNETRKMICQRGHSYTPAS